MNLISAATTGTTVDSERRASAPVQVESTTGGQPPARRERIVRDFLLLFSLSCGIGLAAGVGMILAVLALT